MAPSLTSDAMQRSARTVIRVLEPPRYSSVVARRPGDQHAVLHAELSLERVQVDVVEVASARHRPVRLVAEQRRERRLLADEHGDIDGRNALVEQVRAAGQVVDPRPGQLRPWLGADERLSQVRRQADPGRRHLRRLMRGGVDAEPGDAERELQVGDVLQPPGRVAPWPVKSRHRLCAGERLAVDMCHRRRALEIGDVRGRGLPPASNSHIAPIGTSAWLRIARSSPSCGRWSSSASA